MNPTTARLQLAGDEIHLWMVCPEQVTEPALLERFQSWLSPDEAAQYTRFHFDRHRHRYLITRALVRSVLSGYVARPPAKWDFTKNRYGRPEAVLTPDEPGLRFNLSHTEGMIVCAVALEADIGVDVECMERRCERLTIARHFFAEAEYLALQATPPAQQTQRFFDFWTLKEAYIKARGMGLALGLDKFAFEVVDARPLQVRFEPELEDLARDWRFALLQPTTRHQIAIAVRGMAPRPVRLSAARVVFVEEQDPRELLDQATKLVPSKVSGFRTSEHRLGAGVYLG